jgi:ProP effector
MSTAHKHADAIAAIWLLVEKFPKAFFMLDVRRQPLAIGIHDQIIATGAIEPDQLKLALASYCRSEGYLRALARGGARINCEGEPAGVVTEEQSSSAAKGLAARLARKKAREAEARMACSSSETPAPSSTGPVHGSPAPMSERPKRLGLADLRQLAQARKATA